MAAVAAAAVGVAYSQTAKASVGTAEAFAHYASANVAVVVEKVMDSFAWAGIAG